MTVRVTMTEGDSGSVTVTGRVTVTVRVTVIMAEGDYDLG